jgi:branched-chain amino acid transport system substrate-binding protein
MKKVMKCLFLGAAVAMAAPLAVLADSIKIGFNAPLTGFAAADGNSALVGAQLAVEQVNAAGGINGDQIELITPGEADPRRGHHRAGHRPGGL